MSSKYIYKGSLINLRSDEYHEIVEHPPAVAIIPIDNDENIFLIKQFRRAANKTLIEIPAGIIEKNESEKECAIRELREEIGFFPNKLHSLGGFYLSPGFCDEYLHLFIAEDLIKNPLPPDDGEEIEIMKVSLEKALNLIDNNTIIDSKTITGILMYYNHLNNKKGDK